jgi:YidC/Oxa1 family membrane protein insertase
LAEFSNPNQQGGQDNKSLFAMMALLVAVFFGLQFYRAKTNPQVASPSTPAVTSSQTPGQPAVVMGPGAPGAASGAASAGQTASSTSATAPAVPVVQANDETNSVVENELYRIQFSNRGAQVKSWILKRYKGTDGKPLDLVHNQAAKLFGYPLSLYTYDGATMAIASASRSGNVVSLTTTTPLPAEMSGRALAVTGIAENSFNGTYIVTRTGPNTLTYAQVGDNASSTGGTLSTVNGALGERLSQALFVASTTGPIAAPATLTFKYSNGDVQATKTFSFDETYVLRAKVLVTRNGAPVRALISWPGGLGDQDNANAYNGAQLDTSVNGKEDHLAFKKISGGNTLNGPFDWAGVSDSYFAAVFLPDDPATATVATLHNELNVNIVSPSIIPHRDSAPAADNPKNRTLVHMLGAAVGSTTGDSSVSVYAGPKAVNILKGIRAANPNVTLEPLLNFGFWGPVGKYLFLSLQWIHARISAWPGSWGWAIVILTILINVLMLPFRVKTMQSALKMQRIQPQMDVIKAKYAKLKATDPKQAEKNAEIMQLQKDNGVNMFGGCIPTLITFPLLFAMLGMMTNVVELRQAHWLWLPDLTSPDPFHILPIFMFISMFLVQFYTPSPGVDPQQQKMMAFMMPMVSLYWTWNYASGLALYWAIGNVISIAQQAVMNRTSVGREMREIAAKRARRKSATIQGRK